MVDKTYRGALREQLLVIVKRVGRLEEEQVALASDIDKVCAEAGANGYKPKTVRQAIKDRCLTCIGMLDIDG